MKTYYILIGKYENKEAPYEMIFGDYVKSVVTFEKEVTSDYVGMRVVTLTEDNQAAIDRAIRQLNS